MAEVARARRRFFARHRFLSRWTPRRVLAVCTIAALALLVLSRTDPRLRVAVFYLRSPHEYVMPVAGLDAAAVHSTWHESRPGGRRHEGVDLFSARDTSVVAAADGIVWSVARNKLGGNTVTVVGAGLSVYYYAHLDAWAKNLLPGDRVRAGDVLGAVGNTGDAAGLPPHLHFAVARLSFFGARAVDPAPLLASARVLPFALLLDGTKEPPATDLHSGGREDLEMP